MTRLFRLLLVPLASFGLCVFAAHAETVSGKARRDGTFGIARDDPEMLAAFARAQETIGAFIAALDRKAPGESNFVVKIPVTDKGRTEYFWVNGLTHRGDRFTGKINNTPELVTNVEYGQEISFPESRIRDWGYRADGKMQGNFTTCVLLGREDPQQARELKDQIGLSCQ